MQNQTNPELEEKPESRKVHPQLAEKSECGCKIRSNSEKQRKKSEKGASATDRKKEMRMHDQIKSSYTGKSRLHSQ